MLTEFMGECDTRKLKLEKIIENSNNEAGKKIRIMGYTVTCLGVGQGISLGILGYAEPAIMGTKAWNTAAIIASGTAVGGIGICIAGKLTEYEGKE